MLQASACLLHNVVVSWVGFTLIKLLTEKSLVKLGSWVVWKKDGALVEVGCIVQSVLALHVKKTHEIFRYCLIRFEGLVDVLTV